MEFQHSDLLRRPRTIVIDPDVQSDALAAYTTNIPGQGATDDIGPTLDGLTVTPGVYDIGDGLLNTGQVLHLNGYGIYIFRASSGLTSAGSISLENGARACDVYWRVATLATINGSSFVGTILAGTGIHFGANVTLNGRALAIGNDVTMITDTISGPTCAAPVSTITVVKTVINDNGGSKIDTDFPLFVDGAPVTTSVSNVFAAPAAYTISETTDSNYNQTFSVDCPAGIVTLAAGTDKICIITNDDKAQPAGVGGGSSWTPVVPPLIDLVKVPNPLALPDGPGLVAYTYTLRNIGTVPVTDITMVGDTCVPIVLDSGDANADTKLDVDETWVYKCSTTLTETHTNTVVATGWANGISATDIANATVIVGVPVLVPPLIHVTKVPSPLTLLAAGGMVTYTEQITNPGTVALNNVVLVDDKCAPMNYVSGDTNGDSKLDTTETWTYTCQTNLTKTTLNTATATGDANGFSVRDIAVATVVVSPVVPILPATGFPPEEKNIASVIIGFFGILVLAMVSLGIIRRKQTI